MTRVAPPATVVLVDEVEGTNIPSSIMRSDGCEKEERGEKVI